MVRRIKATQKRVTRIQPQQLTVVTGVTARMRWLQTARPNQLPPEGDWFVWLIFAGRGFGKTRTDAETIAEWARNTLHGPFALVAQTAADARDVMVEGESGLLSILDERELRGGSEANSNGSLTLRRHLEQRYPLAVAALDVIRRTLTPVTGAPEARALGLR